MKFLGASVLENNKAVVVGGGHAGVEAALALSRLKIKTTIIKRNSVFNQFSFYINKYNEMIHHIIIQFKRFKRKNIIE